MRTSDAVWTIYFDAKLADDYLEALKRRLVVRIDAISIRAGSFLSSFLIDEMLQASEPSSALTRSPRQVTVSPMLMVLSFLARSNLVLSVKMTSPSCPWMI